MLTRAWNALAITSKPENLLGIGEVSMGEPGGEWGDTTMGDVASECCKLPLVLSKLTNIIIKSKENTSSPKQNNIVVNGSQRYR